MSPRTTLHQILMRTGLRHSHAQPNLLTLSIGLVRIETTEQTHSCRTAMPHSLTSALAWSGARADEGQNRDALGMIKSSRLSAGLPCEGHADEGSDPGSPLSVITSMCSTPGVRFAQTGLCPKFPASPLPRTAHSW